MAGLRITGFKMETLGQLVRDLSDQQRAAVLARDRYIRIIAVAGAGKTETITRRIVHLLGEGVTPRAMVAFTFTEKAAAQMKERIYRRVEDILGPRATDSLGRMYVGTIHAYCFRLLQDRFGLGNVDMLDQNQETAFIGRHVWELGIAGKGQIGRVGKLLRTAAIFCDELVSMTDLRQEESTVADRLERYFALLERHRLITYGQLVRRACEALARDHSSLDELRHLVVDEFQDINPAQETLIHLMAARASCCVVGDPRQCIYQWRGSDPGCFDRFALKLPGVRDFPITENRRSARSVIEVANAVAASFATTSLREQMTGVRSEDGITAAVAHATPRHEAEWVAEQIARAVDGGRCGYGDVAILLRSVATSGPAFIEALNARRIPYLVGGKVGLFRRPEARALGMLLCWAAGQFWNEDPWRWTPVKGPDLLQRALTLWPGSADPTRLRAAADRLGQHDYRNLTEVYHDFLNALGFKLLDPDSPLDAAILANLGRFNGLLTDYEAAARRGGVRQADLAGLAWYLAVYAQGAYEELPGDDLRGVPAVQLFTVHQAKGLEWSVVFVPCLTDQRFPSSQMGAAPEADMPASLYDARRYAGGEEDERRLFYVAVTRARDTLCLSRFVRIKNAASPSRFLAKLGLGLSKDADGLRPAPAGTGADEELVTVAAADILLYNRCPYAYRLRTCWGYQAPLTPELGYGRSVHHILRVLAERARSGADPVAGMDEAVDREFYLPFASERQQSAIAARVKTALRRYVKAHREELARVQEVESRLEFRLRRHVTVAGRVDALIGPDESLELRDYKTADDPRLLEEAAFQVRLYARGLERVGVRVTRATIADVVEDRNLCVSLTREDLAEAERLALASVEGILEHRYGPRPGRPCRCDFQTICRYV